MQMIARPVSRLMMAGLLAATLPLAACQQTTGLSNQQIGTVLGGIAGAAAGSQIGSGRGRTMAMVIGGLAGAWAGSQIGARLDSRSEDMAWKTGQQSLNEGRPGSWSNPQAGTSGTFTPDKPYKGSDGRLCRSFTQTVTAQGQTERGAGVACQQADGSWRVVQNS